MKRLLILLTLTSYSLFAQDSLNIKLLFNWQDTSITGSTLYANKYNEIWGYAKDGREYAIIGSSRGTHIFDVTNPGSSYLVDFIMGADTGGIIVHRDYHDYNGYLYMVSDEGASTLQIADLSFLPDSVSVVYDTDTLFKTTHNIFIDTAKAKLYAGGVWDGAFTALKVYSLADPVSPTYLGRYDGALYIHDIFVRNDTAYCNAAFEGELHVLDFTVTDTPQLIGLLDTYPDKGLNHSGWLSDDGKTYIMADENWGFDLKVCDVSDLTDIKVSSTITSGVDPASIAHNPIIKGNYAYIAYYHDGLQIFDISNPALPVRTGFYDTYPDPDHISYRGNWGVYPFLPSGIVLASDMQYGLFVFDVSNAVVSIEEQHELTDKYYNIYPNPFRESFQIDMLGKEGFVSLANLLGQEVIKRVSINNNTTNLIFEGLEKLEQGVYILTIEDKAGKSRTSQKIIKVE